VVGSQALGALGVRAQGGDRWPALLAALPEGSSCAQAKSVALKASGKAVRKVMYFILNVSVLDRCRR